MTPRPRPEGLDACFNPRAVAVIGASREAHTIGREILENLIDAEFQGPVFPVNPGAAWINSLKAYSSVGAIPDEVDLAVIVVPWRFVAQVLTECGEKGIGGAVIISNGFKEVGGEGVAREQELLRIAGRHGIRLIGPNCMGIVNTAPAVRLNASFAKARPTPGVVGFMSQSGALGETILNVAEDLGLGLHQFISLGNMADVDGLDMLDYWAADPDIRLVMMYLEHVGDPHRFIEVASRITRTKPVVAVKSGRSAQGARAVSSHTGSLAGSDVGRVHLFEQCGVLRAERMEELFDIGMALVNQPLPRGNRVGIVTNSGGPGILATDALIGHGMVVPHLSPATVDKLRLQLPKEASFNNPVDLTAGATPANFRFAIQALLDDPLIDILMVVFISPVMLDAREVAEYIIQGAGTSQKPLVTVFMNERQGEEAVKLLQASGYPNYRFPESAARALAAMHWYADYLQQPAGEIVPFPLEVAAIKAHLSQADREGWVPFDDAMAILALLGIEPVRSRFIDLAYPTPPADPSCYPLVLKAISPRMLHKSDAGGVIVGIRDEAEWRAALARMQENLAKAGLGPEDYQILEQEMARGGEEVIYGVSRDESLGHLLMFGLGGTTVEVLKDVVFRLAPLTDREAAKMVREIKGLPLLTGFRGRTPVDLAYAEEVLLRLSQLVTDCPEIIELDINPLILTGDRRTSRAVDVRVRVGAVAAVM
ncbi:MAG TPA: acetate--CoA ligase family protein [bacterium]|nr:acetate--CoA ligase family protein [bacterium]